MSHGVNDDKKTNGINFVAPDGGWGWVIVASSLLIHVIMDGITYASGQYLRVFVDDFNASHGAVSVIFGLLPAVTLSCGPIGSSLTNRFGCRFTTIVGAIIATVGFVLTCFAKSIYILYVTIGIVVGIGFGLVHVPAIVSVGYYFEKKRSLAMGIAVCGAGIGTFIFAPINRFLLNKYDWEGAFLIKAGIVFNICVCAAVMIPVAIEPSEILKRKKKIEKSIREKTALSTKSPELERVGQLSFDGIKNGNSEQKHFLQVPKNNLTKIGDSVPIVYNEVQGSQEDSKSNKNNTNEVTQFFKSLPTLAEDEKAKSNEDALYKSYSSLNFIAAMHSLKNINEACSENAHISKDISEVKKIIIADENDIKKEDRKSFDPKIILNIMFLFFAISNFLTSLGFNGPYIYINDQAQSYGIEKRKADMLLQAIGISNTIGRIFLGFLSDFKRINRFYLYSTVITICGLATMIEPFLRSFPLLIIYAFVFGFTSGGYVSLTSILLVDLLGLDNLSNAFGILLVFQGIATAIGPTIAGAMFDFSNSYTISFIFIGTTIAISGIMCYFLPCFKSYKKLHKNKNDSHE